MALHRSYSYTYCNYPNKNIDINKYALEKARLPRSVVFFFIFLQAPSGSAILNLQRGSHDISPIQQPWFSGNKRHFSYTKHYIPFVLQGEWGFLWWVCVCWMISKSEQSWTHVSSKLLWPLKKNTTKVSTTVRQKNTFFSQTILENMRFHGKHQCEIFSKAHTFPPRETVQVLSQKKSFEHPKIIFLRLTQTMKKDWQITLLNSIMSCSNPKCVPSLFQQLYTLPPITKKLHLFRTQHEISPNRREQKCGIHSPYKTRYLF